MLSLDLNTNKSPYASKKWNQKCTSIIDFSLTKYVHMGCIKQEYSVKGLTEFISRRVHLAEKEVVSFYRSILYVAK